MPRSMLKIINPWLQYLICNWLLGGCQNYYAWMNINIGFVLALIYIYMEDEVVFGISKNTPPPMELVGLYFCIVWLDNIYSSVIYLLHQMMHWAEVRSFGIVHWISKWINMVGNYSHQFLFHYHQTLDDILNLFTWIQ